MPAYWGVYYLPRSTDGTPTGAEELCEVDGGTCYMAYRSRDTADAEAREASEYSRVDHGYTYDAYVVRPVPAGTRVYDYTADTVCIAEDMPPGLL